MWFTWYITFSSGRIMVMTVFLIQVYLVYLADPSGGRIVIVTLVQMQLSMMKLVSGRSGYQDSDISKPSLIEISIQNYLISIRN